MKEKKRYSDCICAIILSVISEIAVVLISMKMGDAIDDATAGRIEGLMLSCVMILLFTVLNNVLFLLSVWMNQRFMSNTAISFRIDICDALFAKPLYMFRQKDDAYYSNLLLNDVENVSENDYGMIPVEAKFIALFIGSLFAMARINMWLLLVALVFSLIPFLITLVFEKKLQKETTKCSNANEKLQGEMLQLVHSFEMLKINAVNKRTYREHIYNKAAKKGSADVKKETWQCASYMSIDAVNSLGKLLLIGIGGYFIISDRISTGKLVTCIMLTEYVCSGINNYLEMHVRRKAMLPIRKKIDENRKVMAIGMQCEESEMQKCDAALIYEDVSFGYENGASNILSHFSYKFHKGKSYAIIGESGVGKSTLMRLALRYSDDYEGDIGIKGTSIREISDECLYSTIGYLNQDESIINENFEDNISLFCDDEKRLMKLSDIENNLSLTDLHQRIGDRKLGDFGETISGGEKQRIALARVMFRDPEILILDEPLTGLDADNQRIITDYFFSLSDKTRIMVTHDISPEFLSRFDYVLDMNKKTIQQ